MFKIRIHHVIVIASFIVYLMQLFYPLNTINGSILSQKTLIILIVGVFAWFFIESLEEYFKKYNRNVFFLEKVIQMIYLILTVIVMIA